MPDSVIYDEDSNIALLTLNRPDKLNALDFATVDALTQHLEEIEQRTDLRAVILTGSGKAFSAGADIAEFSGSVKRGVEPALREFLKRGQQLTAKIEGFSKPVVAAVNGIAYGGGCEIAEACTLVVASERALFGKPEIKLGITPTFGGTQRLPRLIGRKRALRMILTGDPITAADAQDMGLVSEVVRHAQLMSQTRNLVHRIIAWSPIAVTACMRSVTRGVNVSIDEGLAIEASQFAVTVPTADSREGIAAFLQKRAPQFTGT